MNDNLPYVLVNHETKYPRYDYCFFIYENERVIGFTHTKKEANNICKYAHELSWEFQRLNTEKSIQIYSSKPQMVFIKK